MKQNRPTTPVRFGVYNVMTKKFQFGISEPTPSLAYQKLFRKIGKDAYKLRYEVKRIPTEQKPKRTYYFPHTEHIDKFFKNRPIMCIDIIDLRKLARTWHMEFNQVRSMVHIASKDELKTYGKLER